jgi:hypothetical protein
MYANEGELWNLFSSRSLVTAHETNKSILQVETMYVSCLISFAIRYNSQQILGSKSDWTMQYDILRKLI